MIDYNRIDEQDDRWYNDKQFCLEAVRQNGILLQHVKNQNEDICLEAVRQDGLSLCFVRHQTEEICLEAIKQDSKAGIYIHKYKCSNAYNYWRLKNY